MMEKKKYEVPDGMMEYLEMVFKRDEVEYEKVDDRFVLADVGKEEFEILLEDAECEKQRMERNPDIPVYSYRTLMNPDKWKRLRKLNGKHGCLILKRDKRKYFAAIGEEDILDESLYE